MPSVVPSQIVAIIEKHFSEIPPRTPKYPDAPILASILHLINALPQKLIAIDGDDFINLTTGIEALRYCLQVFSNKGNADVPMGTIGNPIKLVRDALMKCPDQRPSPSIPTLTFIQDTDLRESIRLDMESAYSAFNNQEWKAAAILAGAATEAILLDAIVSRHSVPTIEAARVQAENISDPKRNIKQDINKWNFIDYIDVAFRLGLIAKDTETACNLCRNYRNAIHPGKIRKGEISDKGAALGALSACETVIRDLN